MALRYPRSIRRWLLFIALLHWLVFIILLLQGLSRHARNDSAPAPPRPLVSAPDTPPPPIR